jgi:hypothetical protein
MQTENTSRRAFSCFILIALVITLCGCPQDQTLTVVANLARDRQTVETYVKEIKKAFRPSDPVYGEAKQRYIAAFSLYQGYLAALRLTIQTGAKGDLRPLATEATIKTMDFISYASDNLPQSHGSLYLLPELKLQESVTSHIVVKKDARQAVEVISAAVQWREWDVVL